MNRRCRCALLLAAALLAGCAAGSAVRPSPNDARHTLWRAEAGRGGTVYLLGSLHRMRPADLHPLPEAMQDAFRAARVVAFELDLDAAAQGAPQMIRRGMLPEGHTLADVLPDSTGRRLRAALDSLHLPVTRFYRMEPWLASVVLPAAALAAGGPSYSASLDRHLFDEAKAAGKERVALETLSDQIAVFDTLSPAAQHRMLDATLQSLGRASAQLDTLARAWRTGDVEALHTLTQSELQPHPALRRRLVTDRNRRWVPQIERLAARADTSLVVVGAGHLVGPGSVVDLLRSRGYDVVQQ